MAKSATDHPAFVPGRLVSEQLARLCFLPKCDIGVCDEVNCSSSNSNHSRPGLESHRLDLVENIFLIEKVLPLVRIGHIIEQDKDSHSHFWDLTHNYCDKDVIFCILTRSYSICLVKTLVCLFNKVSGEGHSPKRLEPHNFSV